MPLELHLALVRAADAHAADMAKYNYFSHHARDGASPLDRASRETTCPPGAGVGENIAMGEYGDAKSLVRCWMKSWGHRRNILHHEYRYMGFGHAADRFVQVFAMQLPPEGDLGGGTPAPLTAGSKTPSRRDPHDY